MKCEKARESDAAKPTSVVLWQWARRNLASDKIAIITIELGRANHCLPSLLSVVLIHSGRVALSQIMSQHSRCSIWEAGEKKRHISQEAKETKRLNSSLFTDLSKFFEL